MTRRLLLILFVFAFAASAGSITYTTATTPAVSTIPLTGTNWGIDPAMYMAFPQWNPLDPSFVGQHLDSAQFTIYGYGEGRIRLYNGNDGEVTLSGTNTITVTLKNLLGGTIVFTIPTFTSGSQTLAGHTDEVYGVSGHETYQTPPYTYSVTPYSNTANTTSGLITSGLGDYTGAGFVNLPVSAENVFGVSGGGGTSGGGSVDTKASAWASVTYNYSPEVPEPAMMTLVGGGLLSLGFIARRRKPSRGCAS